MKKHKRRNISFLLILFVSLLVGSCGNMHNDNMEQAKNAEVSVPPIEKAVSLDMDSSPFQDIVIVYYFHGNFRCASCHKIEKYTKEAAQTYFSSELDSGKLVFKPVNIDEQVNGHFVKDYQLYTKSVVLSLIKDGDEIRYNNLEKVWGHIRNRDQFLSYIKDEVEKYLGVIDNE